MKAKKEKKAAETPNKTEPALDQGRAELRRLNRRDSEEKTARAVAKHCKFVPKSLLEHKQVDGKLLREQVRLDVRELENGKRLGTKYWADLIALYTSDDSSAASSLAPSKVEEVADDLLEALAQMHDDNPANRRNGKLTAYLRTAPPFNQTEWIGMVKVMSDPQIERLRNHSGLMVEWMKFAARTKAKDQFPAELGVCKGLFDKALIQHWASLKKSSIKLSTFLELHLDACSLIMDRTDLLAVVASKDDMSAVRKQLARLFDSSACGAAMFSEHMQHFGSVEFSARIQAIVDASFKPKGGIEESALAACKSDCAKVAKTTATTAKITGKRDIEVQLLGCTLSLRVSSLAEEIDMRIAAASKNVAIGRAGGLRMLSYERWIRPSALGEEIALPAVLVDGPDSARRLVSELIADERIASFSEVARIIAGKISSILVLDPTFRLELCFLDQAEKLIGISIQQAVLGCLPDPSGKELGSQTLAQAAIALCDVLKSEMVKRSCSSAIGQVESVQLVVDNMQRGVSPEVTTGMSQFFTSVLERCALFFEFAKGTDKEMIRGKPGILACTKALEAKFAKGEVVAVAEIEVMRPFWWLLSPKQVDAIQAMLERAIKAATDQGRSSGASSSTANAASSKVGSATKRKKGGADENVAKKASLLKLFRP